MPTDKILDFSLSRLKESIQKTAQKNDRLAFENEMLRQSIYGLQQEKEILIEKKSALSGKREKPDRPKQEMRFIKTVDLEGRRQRTLELIDIFQRDIARLKEEAQVLEVSLGGAEFDSHKQMLLKRKEASEINLIQIENRLKLLRQKNGAPVERIKALSEKQNELVREIRALEDRLYRF